MSSSSSVVSSVAEVSKSEVINNGFSSNILMTLADSESMTTPKNNKIENQSKLLADVFKSK